MGFYDYRCSVSGLSLMPSYTYLILLEKIDDGYRPLSLPVHGCYDRLGSVDGVEEDDHTRLLVDFATRMVAAERMTVDWEEVGKDTFEDIEDVLRASERSSSQGYDALTLDGVRIVHTMISDEIWNALADPAKHKARSASELMDHVFGAASKAHEIYASGEGVRDTLAAMAGFMDFMSDIGESWTVRDDYEQHYGDELREYLDEARERFADRPDVLEAIDRHEEDCQEIFDEEDEDD